MSPWKFEALEPSASFDAPEFAPLQSLWLAKRDGGKAPSWRSFDPIELKPWIGNLAVIDAPNDSRKESLADYRYRLWGTRLTELFGADLTGKFLREAGYGAHEPRMRQLFGAVTTGQIALSSGSVYWQDRGYRRFRSIFLPLSSGGAGIDQMLGVSMECERSTQWAEVG